MDNVRELLFINIRLSKYYLYICFIIIYLYSFR